MPGEVDLTANQRAAMLVQWALDATKASLTPGETPEQVAVRLATLHGALMGLTFAAKTDEPPA
jgi:hypothetical protein